MKVWEKIMLYPIGLCYWFADKAKKTGKFIGRKAKPAIAMLVAVTMMLSLMPITAFAASNDIIVGGANLGDGSTTVYYKNGDTSGNLTGTAEDYNAKLETVGGVATLTIKNLSVAKTADAGIKSYVSLNLVLEGASSIAEKDDDSRNCRGIFVNGDLTISGDGVLSVTAGDAADDDSYGIYVNGTLTIKSGTINATGGAASGSSYGIYATSAVLIEDGTVNATGGTAGSAEGNVSCGIGAWDGVAIYGGTVNATGGAAYSSYGIEICYEISGGTVVATGGDAVDDSFGITRGTSNTEFNGGVVVMRGGTVSDPTGSSNAYYSFGIDSISLDGTKLAGQVVDGTFTGSPESYNKNATALAIVPSSYTVQNTPITGTNHTIDTNTAVVTPGTGSNGVPLVITESGSTVTLNGDLVLINLLGEFFTPAFSVNGDTTVSGSGSLTAVGAATSNSWSYGISGNCSLSVDGAKIVAIGGPASKNSYGIGASVDVDVRNGGSVIAIGGAMGNVSDSASYGIKGYSIKVTDGTVTAIGGMAADSYGISNYATADFTGSTVNVIGGAASKNSYGIGAFANVNVSSGSLNAIGSAAPDMSCGIYSGSSYKITVAKEADVAAIGGNYGLYTESGSLASGDYIGSTAAIYCESGVNSLLANGYGYFAGETQLIPADSDATVGEANQTVTVKEAPIPHSHCVCGAEHKSIGDHTTETSKNFEAWDNATSLPQSGSYCLNTAVVLTATANITGELNLCLNGHIISAAGGYFDVAGTGTLNLCSCKDNGIIKRTTTTNALISADAGATANLYNVTLDGGAVWEGTTDTVLKRGTTNSGITSSAPLIYAGGQRTAGGHITLNSGVILQNNECSDAGDGGAITLGEDGTLVINGATICNNAKTAGNAGAIKAYAGAQITVNSGEIYGNEAYKHGGAVQIFGGDSTDYATAVFTMNGGTIRNNKADGVGGGVAVSDYSSFTMNGGTIKDNATTDYSKRGGGVGFGDKNTAMSISGNAVISGNVAGINANNLYIGNNDCNKLSVETMGSNANVGVTMSSPGVFSSGGASYAAQFNSDNAAYKVATDGSNLKLVALHTHNYTYSANGYVITESCTCGHEETATVSGPTGTIVYDGTEKKGATVSYSTGWLGGTLTVTYQNNINAGQATASITNAGATVSVKFTINKAEPDYTLPMGVTATYGDTLEDIKISDWGSGWSWKEPTISVGDVGTKTFVAVFTPTDTDDFNAAEVDVSVTVGKANSSYTAPTAKELVYNGSAQTLVNAGSTTTGSMQYALGSITEPTGSWSATLPQGQNAGTYYVWYKVVGDENHNDVAPACVAVTIAKKQIAKPAADNSTFTYNGNYQTYALNEDPAFIIKNNVQKNADSYAVTVTLRDMANYEWTDGTTAMLEYAFKIEQKEIDIGWGATMFLPYTGNSLLPKATATNLVDGDTCTLTTEVVETTEGAGVIPGEWTAKVTALSNNNYKLPASGVRVIVTFEIVNGYQNYAPVVSGTNETIDGKGDGKITGVDNTMEYRKEGEISYTAVSGSEVTGLHDGIYYVRYAAKTYYNPSPEAQVTIGAGRKLTVTVPQNQVGYTMTVDKSTAAYGEAVKVTFVLNDGYSAADGFAVKLNGSAITLSNGEYTVANTTEDLAFTVEGVADITAPLAQIDIKNNKWTSFWNGVTFGLFFNETQDVTVTATDTGSGVNAIQYYLASGELELEEVKQIPVWQDYNATFQINPDNAYVVYVKVTDNAGNVSYLNSDGVVLDQTVPVLVGIENNESYYGDKRFKALDDYLDDLKVDGVDVTDEMNGDNEYTIVADNAEHIVTVTDKAGNVTEYRITVYKNYTVTYKVDGNTISTQTVGHGKDATAPEIPEKEGYTQTAPVWDKDGKNITADTEINAVYTINEYTITFMDENGVYKTLTYKHGEAVTMPEAPAKDGYTVTWNATIEKATGNATVNAVYTKNAVSDNPQTGDNSNLWLWWILLIVSAFGITVICIEQKKRKAMR